MRIVQLQAENFKRLGIVEINPDGNLVTIGGNNGNGKSSVLDAIYVALKGRAVAPPQPIRKGAEKCTIRLDMGDIVVTRNFHAKEGGTYTDTLKVENADGLRYKESQTVLSALLGEIGFDPFEFVNLKPKDQVSRLLQMVPLSVDLDELAEEDVEDRTARRDINRDAKALEVQIAAIPKEDVPEKVPDKDALTDRLSNAANTNSAIDRERLRRETVARQAEHCDTYAANAKQRAAELRAEAEKADQAEKEQLATAAQLRAELEDLPELDEFEDTDELRAELRAAEAVLATIERQNRRAALVRSYKEKIAQSEALTEALKDRETERNKALSEAEMPVPGLSFAIDAETGAATLMWEGLTFDKDQISTAVQLRVSTAIGMAANPRLRVLRIKDGSLLDPDSMKMLGAMADAEDFQLWVEVVGDGGVGFIMENGEVRGAEHEDQDDSKPEPETEEKPEAKPKTRAKKGAEQGGLL